MASSTTWLVVGVIAGVGIGVGAAMLMRQSSTATARAPPEQPTFTEHTVVRDDHGRIISVQSVEGVGGRPTQHTRKSATPTPNPDFIA